jgi:hypothetical protein
MFNSFQKCEQTIFSDHNCYFQKVIGLMLGVWGGGGFNSLSKLHSHRKKTHKSSATYLE